MAQKTQREKCKSEKFFMKLTLPQYDLNVEPVKFFFTTLKSIFLQYKYLLLVLLFLLQKMFETCLKPEFNPTEI